MGGGGGQFRGSDLGGGGVRVDGNGELKLLRKFQKKNNFFFGGGGGGGGGGGRVGRGGASGWGVRVDVNGEVKFL